MPDDTPKTLKLSPMALFRYQIVSFVLALCLDGKGKTDAVRHVAGLVHPSPSGPRSVAERTIWSWVGEYNKLGLEGLETNPRSTISGSLVIPDALLDWFGEQHDLDPDSSCPALIRLARAESKIGPVEPICRQTVVRALGRRGVVFKRGPVVPVRDARRFAYRERMQLLMLDFKYFRAGPTRVKRLALYALDDATRFGLDVRVTTSGESSEVVLHFLHDIICRYGLPDAIYVDRGPGFIADAVALVMGQLNKTLIIGRRRYPQGRGKIERFNRSVKARLLRHLDRREGLDVSPGALELLLRHDLHEDYNRSHHESLRKRHGDACTPYDAWHGSDRALSPVESDQRLIKAFTIALEKPRRVSNDHVISVDGVDYEVPRGYAKKKLIVFRRVLESTDDTDALYIDHEGKLLRVHPVDLEHNAQSPRAQEQAAESAQQELPLSASEINFRNTFAPMTGPDGGYDDEEN